jgi:hypothetical protein
VGIIPDLLLVVRWKVRLLRLAWVARIQHLIAIGFVMGSAGIGIGYAIATRGRRDWSDEVEDQDPDADG